MSDNENTDIADLAKVVEDARDTSSDSGVEPGEVKANDGSVVTLDEE